MKMSYPTDHTKTAEFLKNDSLLIESHRESRPAVYDASLVVFTGLK
jgi:hypothetical protein